MEVTVNMTFYNKTNNLEFPKILFIFLSINFYHQCRLVHCLQWPEEGIRSPRSGLNNWLLPDMYKMEPEPRTSSRVTSALNL